MRIILTKKEYEDLLDTGKSARAQARNQVQAELETVKDDFIKSRRTSPFVKRSTVKATMSAGATKFEKL